MAVRVAAGAGDVAHERDRERVLGLPAAGLAFGRSCRECHGVAIFLFTADSNIPSILAPEHLRMRSESSQYQLLRIGFPVDKHQVRPHVAVSVASPVPSQSVVTVAVL